MMGTDETRGQEYGALMAQTRDLGRTSLLCWTGATVAAAVLLAGAIGAKNPGLMLPVEFCAAFGFYATVQSRRRLKLIEGYLQEFHERDRDGAQWHTRLANLHALPGAPDRTDWLPLALANAATLAAVVFAWVYASEAAHGELMAGFTTMAGVAFSVHSMVEHMNLEQVQGATPWSQSSDRLHEVPGGVKRVTSLR